MILQWVTDIHGRLHISLAVGPISAWEVVATVCWRAIAIAPEDWVGPPIRCPECTAWVAQHRLHLRHEIVQQVLGQVETEPPPASSPERQLATSSTR